MFKSNRIKNYENTKEIQKELDYEKRLCDIYGLCGIGMSCSDSHQVSHFGLKKLNEQKSSV